MFGSFGSNFIVFMFVVKYNSFSSCMRCIKMDKLWVKIHLIRFEMRKIPILHDFRWWFVVLSVDARPLAIPVSTASQKIKKSVLNGSQQQKHISIQRYCQGSFRKVCKRHFRTSDYETGSTRLKQNVVPSLHLPHQSSVFDAHTKARVLLFVLVRTISLSA